MSEMQSRTVNVWCANEGRVVGVLPAPTIGACSLLLSRQWVWREFVPAAPSYRLGALDQRDGETMRCPHCLGELSIEGAIVAPAEALPRDLPRNAGQPLTREQARARAVAEYGNNARTVAFRAGKEMPIVLGATRLEARP